MQTHSVHIHLVLCILLTPLLSAQELPLQNHYQSFTFAVVRIPIWATNGQGLPVSGLKEKDFRLYVDGQKVAPQRFMSLQGAPMSLVYLIDLSGSMAMNGKLKGSVETVDWLINRHQEGDHWQVVVFSDGQILKVADHEHKAYWPEVRDKLKGYGKTALFDTLALAESFFPETGGHHHRALLVFTDGFDNHSSLDQEHLVALFKVLRVPVFFVAIASGYVPRSDITSEIFGLQSLQKIAEISGGLVFVAPSAEHLPSIGARLRGTLRPQYLLTLGIEHVEQPSRHDLAIEVVKRQGFSGPIQLRHRSGFLGSLP